METKPFSEYLKEIRDKYHLSQKELASILGVTIRSVSGWENGTYIPRESAQRDFTRIIEEAGDNILGLLPLKTNVYKFPKDIHGNVTVSWKGVPMYDIPVTAGAISLIRDENAPEPAYYLQIPSFKDCTFGARVSGDSMYPEIRNGDYVVCKELQSMDSLIFGDIYLVVTNDGMETVKYVHPHEDNPEWIKLVPYNKSVPPTPMPKSNIFKVYKVKGVLKGY